VYGLHQARVVYTRFDPLCTDVAGLVHEGRETLDDVAIGNRLAGRRLGRNLEPLLLDVAGLVEAGRNAANLEPLGDGRANGRSLALERVLNDAGLERFLVHPSGTLGESELCAYGFDAEVGCFTEISVCGQALIASAFLC